MDETRSTYIHGTAPDEQRRLSLMNDIINAASLGELRLTGGERVLDVGCGLAQLTRAIARAIGPSGRVLGIDQSREQLEAAHRLATAAGEDGLVELRHGEATALPLAPSERGSFDLAHARFVLEHTPEPLAVVREMVAAVRPGGRVVLEDDDHDLLRLDPEPPALGAVWRAYVRTYDRNRNDPFVGRRLVALLHQGGARPSRATWLFFGSSAGAPSFSACVENLASILAGARPPILATGLEPALLEQALVELERFARRPDASIGYAIPWAEGVRPP